MGQPELQCKSIQILNNLQALLNEFSSNIANNLERNNNKVNC